MTFKIGKLTLIIENRPNDRWKKAEEWICNLWLLTQLATSKVAELWRTK